MYYKSLSLYVKNSKKILLCEKNVIDENGIFAFLKKMALQNYFILYLLLAYFLSKMMSEKIGDHPARFFFNYTRLSQSEFRTHACVTMA